MKNNLRRFLFTFALFLFLAGSNFLRGDTLLTAHPAITGIAPASGCVGTAVTLSGTDFTGATSVQFNGTAAEFTVDSNTQISAIVPTGASTGPVSVVTPGGSVYSATDFTIQPLELTYMTANDAVTIIGYTGTGGAVTIPVQLEGLPVTAIGQSAFYGKTGLITVTLPDSVTIIGNTCFEGCSNLTNLTFGSGLSAIGYHPFFNCPSISSFTVSSSNPVYSSSNGILFDKSRATLIQYPQGRVGSYTVPAGVTDIAYGAFDHCTGLTGVTIPDTVTRIEDGAFYACTALSTVDLGSGVVSLGNQSFYSCTSLGSITIPDSVTTISGAFSDCTGLTSVTLGSQLVNITGAFVRCSKLTGIVIPPTVTDIGNMAFAGCSSLAGVTISGSVTRIGDSAFSACHKLTGIPIPASVVSIGQYAFDECILLESITLPSGLTSILQYTFRNCYTLGSIAIPDSVTGIGWGAFYQCSGLAGVSLGSGVATIEDWAFSGCSNLSSFYVNPANPTFSSADGVLFNKSFQKIIKFPEAKSGNYALPGSVSNIANYAFQDAKALTNVIIPRDVAVIGDQAFYNCINLSGIYFSGTAPAMGSSVFSNDPLSTIYYLSDSSGWSNPFAQTPAAVWPAPVINSAVPSNDTTALVTEGDTLGFSVAAQVSVPGHSLDFAWYSSKDGGVTWSSLPMTSSSAVVTVPYDTVRHPALSLDGGMFKMKVEVSDSQGPMTAQTWTALSVQDRNRPPCVLSGTAILTAPVSVITPSSPATGEALVCTVAEGVTDPDNEDGITYEFTWLRNATPGLVHTGSSRTDNLLAGNVVAGEVWSCSVRALDPLGAATNSGLSASVTIVQTPFENWKSGAFTTDQLANPAFSGVLATPAHDGMPNLVKYAFGLSNPTTPGTSYLPSLSKQNGYLTLSYRQSKQAVDVTFVVEACSSLASAVWTSVSTEVSRVDHGAYFTVTIRDDFQLSENPRRFMRLKVLR